MKPSSSQQSQQRTAAAQAAGRLDAEIVLLTTVQRVVDRDSGEATFVEALLDRDEGNRPDSRRAGLAALQPVIDGGSVTAGNACQLSDGAAACVLMDAQLAAARGLEPLGSFRGVAVAGCAPDEMGMGAAGLFELNC